MAFRKIVNGSAVAQGATTATDVTSLVESAVSELINAAPAALDTLNELAAALGDDANFATTINTSITDGDAATLAAAENYTDNALANFTTLPDQTDNAGKYLTTDGTDASWAQLTNPEGAIIFDENDGGLAVSVGKGIRRNAELNRIEVSPGDGVKVGAESQVELNINPTSSGLEFFWGADANSREVRVDTDIIASREYVDEQVSSIPVVDLQSAAGAGLLYNSNENTLELDSQSNVFATPGYVDSAVAGLVDSAPGTLNTLNELAAALGDDANFATTVTNSIASKADSENPEFTIAGQLEHTANSYTQISSGGLSYEFYYSALSAPVGFDLSTGSEVFLTGSTINSSNIDNIVLSVMSGSTAGSILLQPKNVSDRTAVGNWVTIAGNGSYMWFPGSTQPTLNQNYSKTISSDELAYLDNSTDNLQDQIDEKSDKLVSFVSVSGSKTLALTDADKMLEISAAATITIPTDASVAFPVGTGITLAQTGTGTVTVAAASGVTLNFTPSATLRTQWSTAMLVKRSTNTWLLSGDLL